MEFNTYNKEDNSELRKLQLTILDLIKMFAEICEKHHLRYFMVGGTMLGAATMPPCPTWCTAGRCWG